jgi:hypothetical protein
MHIADTFKQFSALLGERLRLGVLTTEDSIRYTFYIALLSSGDMKHTDVILEHPHPLIPGAEIDTIIRGVNGRQPLAVEFKYDRGNPGGTNQNRTQRAAAVVGDMFRLVKVPNSVAGGQILCLRHRRRNGKVLQESCEPAGRFIPGEWCISIHHDRGGFSGVPSNFRQTYSIACSIACV